MNVRRVLPPDAIPSVDDPEFVDEYEAAPDDEVIGVELAGEPRAYPVRYLHYHEIVNDQFGDRHVAVTWCPLCGSAVVYDRAVDGRLLEFGVSASEASGDSNDSLVLSFGVSGKLADDDLVMYDRESESEWKQSLGTAIAGPLEGTELTVLPASMTTWAQFREAHSDGQVLAPPGGESEAASDSDEPAPIDYDAAPYDRYFEMDGFGLAAHRGGDSREWHRDDLDPKAVVLGIERAGDALGFPLPEVRAAGGVATATVGGSDVLVVAGDAGIHAFEHPGGAVEFDDAIRAAGTTWEPATGESADGRQLTRLPARRLFAFAWQDDHGDSAFWFAE